MYICFLNHNVIATYGVGSGNTPAFLIRNVGHLLVALF